MRRTKFCITKIFNNFYALKSSKIIDVINGYDEMMIELLTTDRNKQLFYNSQPMLLINSYRIFEHENTNQDNMSSILVISENTKDTKKIFGLPIHEIACFEYFENNVLTPFKFNHANSMYSCSFKHNKKPIYMLEFSQIANYKSVKEAKLPEISFY